MNGRLQLGKTLICQSIIMIAVSFRISLVPVLGGAIDLERGGGQSLTLLL